MGCLTVSPSRVGSTPGVCASRIGQGLRVTAGIVCTAGRSEYLRVSPEEVQWLTPYNTVIYAVRSNLEWRVEQEQKQ